MKSIKIVSPQCPRPVLNLLREQGCHFIFSKEQHKIPFPERFHADLQVFAADQHTAVAAPLVYEYYQKTLQRDGIQVLRGKTDSNGHYPQRTAYNVARVGTTAFCFKKSLDPVVFEELDKRQVSICPVRQGYAACSVVPLNSRALVTSDPGIAAAAKQEKLECLLVSPNGIVLPGCKHGLIGGCFCMVRPGLSIAAGDVSLYPWGKTLLAFFARHEVMLLGITGKRLFDFGGILSLEGK